MLHIFSDASCSKKYGVGCYCILSSLNDILDIKVYELMCHQSTTMEFMTILNALESINNTEKLNISLYTDCNNFIKYTKTKKTNAIDEDIILRFDKIFYNNNINVIKIKGHSKKCDKTTKEQEIFHIIDKFARKSLRNNKYK